MSMNKVGRSWSAIITWLGLTWAGALAQLPTNFPTIVVSNYMPAAVSPGCIFLAVASKSPEVGNYLLILTNDGTIVWYREAHTNEIYDFKMLPNGLLHYAAVTEPHCWTDGGDVAHQILHQNYTLKERITGGNGYVADGHDFQLLPNGHILQICYYLSEVDMSRIVEGGHPAARVSGAVIQELDSQRNVVFQWRTWDHYGFETNLSSTNAIIDAFHVNTVMQDFDGHIIFATPQWVKKINRQTGDIIWHLGGPENEFAFAGGGGPGDFGGHGFNLLPNGRYLICDNGSSGSNDPPAKAHEYILDQVNKVATRVWSYTSSPAIYTWRGGNAQRLPNGNTFIGWGGPGGPAVPACTEVTPTGQKVLEIYFANPSVESYRAFKFIWPPNECIEYTQYELATGNIYSFGDTGVTIEVLDGGFGYNMLTVTREPYAPIDPVFPWKSPRVLPMRVKLTENEIPTITAIVSFDAQSFGFAQPTNLIVYYRSCAGQGIFQPQPTSYNPVTGQLLTQVTLHSSGGDLGEFIFCHPDLPDVPYPPLLNRPENYRGLQLSNVIAPPIAATGAVYTVNQELPVLLSWSPKGLARWYHLQVSTNAVFSNLVVNRSWMTEARYIFSNAAPNTTYYWRVKTITQNDDYTIGESSWAVGSFTTVPPMLELTFPNGGEVLLRGRKYFIRWTDNIAESVVIELYKGGNFLKSVATNSSAGAHRWEVGFDLVPGHDYTIKVRSLADAALSDTSDATFSIIDMPSLDAQSLVRLSDGSLRFALEVPGAAQATVLGSTNLSLWEQVAVVMLTNGTAVFTDAATTNLPWRFYRVRVP